MPNWRGRGWWAWRRAATRCGSSACWLRCISSCAWAMRARSGPWRCASRRRIGAMPHCCCACCWRIAFPRCGCRRWRQRDTRQLLLHRHKLVGMRRQVKNELQHLALNQGVQQKRKLWSVAGRQRLEELPLAGWTARRREGSLELLDELDSRVAKLDAAVQQAADKDAVARLSGRQAPGLGK